MKVYQVKVKKSLASLFFTLFEKSEKSIVTVIRYAMHPKRYRKNGVKLLDCDKS